MILQLSERGFKPDGGGGAGVRALGHCDDDLDDDDAARITIVDLIRTASIAPCHSR